MVDIAKHAEFFNPSTITEEVHIIGAGAVGSTLCEMLTRIGIRKIHLYDFDTVTPHNLANQMFWFKHIHQLKVDAVEEICKAINPEIEIVKFPKGYTNQSLKGHVFLAADQMEVRQKVAKGNQFNQNIKTLCDFRMGLSEGQHFFVDWKNAKQIVNYINGTNFTNEETEDNAPRNACGMFLNIIPTVRTLVSIGIMNFIKYKKDAPTKNIIAIELMTNTVLEI